MTKADLEKQNSTLRIERRNLRLSIESLKAEREDAYQLTRVLQSERLSEKNQERILDLIEGLTC